MSGPITVGTVANGARSDAPAGSVLDGLRKAAVRQRKERTIDLPVGGAFGERLVVRYGTLPIEELDRYAELQGNITNVALAIDMMVSTCRTVLWREDGQETDLGVGLGTDLWELLDWPLPEGVEELTPREVVLGLFGAKEGMRLGNHLAALVAFNNEGEPEPGEASAPTS